MMMYPPRIVAMKYKNWIIAIIALFICSACLDTADKLTSNSVNPEERLKRQQQTYAEAEADPQQFKASLKENCPHFGNALLTTAETIQLGTRLFNAGGVSLTQRIYEGAVYKLLFEIKDECMDLSDTLQMGLANSEQSKGYHDKAWALRNALDLIMGGPPSKPPGAQ